jgi:kumamolisin
MTLGSAMHTIGGDVGVGAVGAASVGTQLTIGNGDQLDTQHTVYAPSASLGSQAIAGDVCANTLNNGGGVYGTLAPYPAGAMPQLPVAIAGTPNTSNITVAAGQQRTLSPGSYGALADNGIVLLQPGAYSFASVALGNSAQLQALQGGPTTVGVAGAFSTGTFAQVFPAGQPAGALSISVAGRDGASPAGSLGANTQIVALLDVPRATLALGSNVLGTGAFAGFFLTSGSNVTLTFQSGFPASSQQPAGSQALTNSFLPAVSTSPLVGPLPGSTVLSLNLALPLQLNGAQGSNMPPLMTFIETLALSDGGVPLTPTTFGEAYGPPAANYSNIQLFANANGLTITRTFGSKTLLSVTTTAANAEQVFFTDLNLYQRPDGTTFFAPASPPSAETAVPLVGVLGLDSYSRPLKSQTGPPDPDAGNGNVTFPAPPPPPPTSTQGASYSATSNVPCHGSPNRPGGSFWGTDFISTYLGSCLDSATSPYQGQGQTIAVLELDYYNPADVVAYAQGTSLGESTPLPVPGLSGAVGADAGVPNLTNITQELAGDSQQFPFNMVNAANQTPIYPDDNANVDSEPGLDIDMVLSMAPQANIIVYEPTGPDQGLAVLAQAADDDLASVVTCSWQWPVATYAEQLAVWSATAQMATQSQSFFQSAGDLGSLVAKDPYQPSVTAPQNGQPEEPVIDSPFMTVVGGTAFVEASGLNVTESTWNNALISRYAGQTPVASVTAGGFCTGTSPNPAGAAFAALPMPAWQQGLNLYGNTEIASPVARMIPDVSMAADPIPVACGVGVEGCGFPLTAFGSALKCTGGTSASTPLWAGFMALVNQARGVGQSPSGPPVGFANPILYQLATSTSTTAAYTSLFNDIADQSNNNWFDDGTQTEVGVPPSLLTATPAVAAPWVPITVSGTVGIQGVAISGVPATGQSEDAGLYHAVQGYDLATGLGTPTCQLFQALAPNAIVASGSSADAGTGDAGSGVVINYHQVGQCNGFPFEYQALSAGAGFGFVVFGIDSIINNQATPFNFDPMQLFVPTGNFPTENSAPLTSCVQTQGTPVGCPYSSFPTPFATTATVAPNSSLTLSVDAGGSGTQFIMVSVPLLGDSEVEASYFLNYNASSDGGVVSSLSVLPAKANPTAAEAANLPNNGNCGAITLQ